MNTMLKLGLGVGAGGVAFFAFMPRGFASEDNSGATVSPAEARPSLPTPAVTPGSSAAAAMLGAKAIEVLYRNIGAKEEPPGSNRGPIVDQIMRGVHSDGVSLIGKPWCSRTIRYGFEKAAQELGLPPPFAGIRSTLAFVTDWRDKFKDYCLASPRPGMVALIINGSHRHATLVSRVDGDNVYTVEGNHNDQIAAVKRPSNAFAVFVDVEAYTRRSPAISIRGEALDLLGA